MKLHRFYIEENNRPLGEEVLEIDNKDITHQVRNVLRLDVDDQVILFDGKSDIEYRYRLVTLQKNTCTLQLVSQDKAIKIGSKNLTLCIALIKSGTEDIIRSAVEIGVSNIQLVLSDRTERKEIGGERLNKISVEASEQSGRVDIVHIGEPQKIDRVFDKNKTNIVYHTQEVGGSVVHETETKNQNTEVYAWIGPEGGWTDAEIEHFVSHGAQIRKLETYILKTVTAGVVCLYDATR
jgi:16S rRNA (uracil1498-N3)-methyltransferase